METQQTSQPQIDSRRTVNRVRDEYETVTKFCASHSIKGTAMFYKTVSQGLGTKKGARGRYPTEALRILEVLREKNLLIMKKTEAVSA